TSSSRVRGGQPASRTISPGPARPRPGGRTSPTPGSHTTQLGPRRRPTAWTVITARPPISKNPSAGPVLAGTGRPAIRSAPSSYGGPVRGPSTATATVQRSAGATTRGTTERDTQSVTRSRGPPRRSSAVGRGTDAEAAARSSVGRGLGVVTPTSYERPGPTSRPPLPRPRVGRGNR